MRRGALGRIGQMPRKQEGDIERGTKKAAAKAAAPFQASAVPPCVVLLNPLIWILWLLDFLVWLITIILPLLSCCFCCRRCCKRYSVEDDEEDEDNLTCRRSSNARWSDGLLEHPTDDPEESDDEGQEATTAYALLMKAFDAYEDSDCFGTRDYLYMDNSRSQPRRVFGETNWLTYGEVGERAHHFGAGLRQVGLQPLPAGVDLQTTAGPHTFLIFEDTSAYWMTAMVGAFSQSIVVATSYATLGIQSVGDAVQECNVRALMCNRKNVEEIIKLAPPSLETVIYTDHYVTPDEARVPPIASNSRIKVLSFEQVIQLGAGSGMPPTPPSSESLAVIMYTSGSTGKPKGVMITQGSIAASVSAIRAAVPALRPGKESYVAYLPAAHIFELCAETSMITLGAKIGFADPRTLLSTGAVRRRDDGELHEEDGYPDPPGALQEFQPTMMVAVPIVWDTFKKRAEEKLGSGSCVVRHLFMAAYSAQYLARKLGTSSVLLKFLVLRKLKAMMGGRMKVAVTGGGPISSEVQDFISTAFCFPLLQGYGLTETTCAGAIQTMDDVDTGVLGGPVGSVEIKLRSCDHPEDPTDEEGMAYLADDDDHMGVTCHGRGEICVRGPSLSRGYFKQPDVTMKAFEPTGWFRTGDIGYWDAKGRLVIVDRLKNLVKLKGGEYIAIEKMEKEYATSPFVDGTRGGVMCYGDGEMRRPGALVQVNVNHLKKWAAGAGLPDNDVEALCRRGDAEDAVLKNLLDCAKGRIGDNEKLVAVRLISGLGPAEGEPTMASPWSPENECQTPSRKLNRQTIKKVWAAYISALQQKGA